MNDPVADPAISGIGVSAYSIPTERTEGDGTLTWDHTTWVIAEAYTSDLGAPVGVGWTYAPEAAATVIHDLLEPEVLGRSALDVGAAWTAMVRAVRNAGRPGLVSMAISAVDTALWDLKARLLEVPLHRLLGQVAGDVPVYGSGGFTTDTETQLAEQLDGWLAQGIDQVKIKIAESDGHNVTRDLARVALARDVVGADTALFVDANGGYGVGQAVRVARRLEELAVTWFEEPVSSDDHRGLRWVRDHSSLDVAAGEYGSSLAYFSHLLDAEAVDCVQIDVTRCGGYTEWLRIAALAAAHGLQVSAHCAPSLHRPVALATRGLRHVEWFHDHVRIEERFLDGFPSLVAGAMTPPDGPGHGLTVRVEELAEFRVR